MLTKNERNWPLSRQFVENFWNIDNENAIYTPNIEINKTEDHYEITAQLPGISSKDLNVKIDGSILTISGKKEHKKEKSTDTLHSEIQHFTEFKRVLRLDESLLKTEDIKAELKDGLLKIKLPFEEEEKQIRQIPVLG